MAKKRKEEGKQTLDREAYAQSKMQEAMKMHEDAFQKEQDVLNQQENNKSHDTEFSQYSEGTNAEAETLGVITDDTVKEAYQTLMDYKAEKSNLERRIAENERFWKMQHWDLMAPVDDGRIRPKSGWLVNTLRNKHADAMDNYPEANILPRARDDEETAKILSDVIPVILDQNDFQHIYDRVQWYKIKNGTGVYGVFWNNDKNNGLGDIDVKKIDLTNLYWKGGISDINESQNVFYVTMMDNKEIASRYPQLKEVKSSLPISAWEYNDDENIDRSEMSPVIDWYYRKRVQTFDDYGIPQTKTILHYCQFCNGKVIYASENDPTKADEGWYKHGSYPFIFDVMYPVEGSICGMGEIDVVKDDQMYIDKLQQAILENAVANARPRYAVRNDGDLNEEEFLDLSKPLIHFDGNLGEDSFRQIAASPLAGIYETVYLQKVQEMKDTSGNTAASQGQTSSVTSASGIASLQEAAGKLSRDMNLGAYRAYKQVIDMIIELIREFYDEPRCFRITGNDGQNSFVEFDNTKLMPQNQGMAMGIDLGSRLPIMDIDVRPQKKNAYSREAQNQTALNLYNLGFFAPNNADGSLACLDMMDFEGIEKVRDKIGENGTLYDQVMQLQQMLMQLTSVVDAQNGTNMTEKVANGQMQTMNIGNGGKKGAVEKSKGSLSSQAASATRGSTSPT